VVGVVAVGWAWGAHSTEQPARVVAASSSPVTGTLPVSAWTAGLHELDGARADAFALADPAGLVDVYAPGSALLAADQRAVAALARLRRTAVEVAHEVRSVTPLRVSADRVELKVVESLGGFEVLDSAGRVVEEHPPGAVATHAVVLISTAQGWRVTEVRQG
jgi:hypothetical protein